MQDKCVYIFQGLDLDQAHGGKLWGNMDLTSSKLVLLKLYHGLAGYTFLCCLTDTAEKQQNQETCRDLMLQFLFAFSLQTLLYLIFQFSPMDYFGDGNTVLKSGNRKEEDSTSGTRGEDAVQLLTQQFPSLHPDLCAAMAQIHLKRREVGIRISQKQLENALIAGNAVLILWVPFP